MATVRDIIRRAMRRATIIATGENPDADEIQDGLETFRALIDHHSLDGVLLHTEAVQTFALTSGKRTYTWGSGGDFDGTPPERVIAAWLNESGGRDVALKFWGPEDHAQVELKDTVERPGFVWIDRDATTWTVYFPKVPFDPSVSFLVSQPLANTQALSEATGFPKGYDDAFAWELAMWLAPEYGKEVSQITALRAREGVKVLRRQFQRVPNMRTGLGGSGPLGDYHAEEGPL